MKFIAGDDLVVFYYFSRSEIWLEKRDEWLYKYETILQRTTKTFGDLSKTFEIHFCILHALSVWFGNIPFAWKCFFLFFTIIFLKSMFGGGNGVSKSSCKI